MKNEFVTYEQAVKLKGLGFDEKCMSFYAPLEPPRLTCIAFKDGQLDYSKVKNSHKLMGNGRVTAPLKQQVFRWFREKFNIDSHIEKYLSSEDAIEYFFMANDKESVNFDTYEEANFACINYLVSLIEAKN